MHFFVIHQGISIFLLARISLDSGFMSFIQRDHVKPTAHQCFHFIPIMGQNPGRDDSNLCRTASNILGFRTAIKVAMMIYPSLSGCLPPDTGWQTEFVSQFHLPLPDQGGRTQDESRPMPHQDRQGSNRGHGQGFANSDIICKQQPGRAIFPVVINENSHEFLLPGSQPFAISCQWTFHQNGFCQFQRVVL